MHEDQHFDSCFEEPRNRLLQFTTPDDPGLWSMWPGPSSLWQDIYEGVENGLERWHDWHDKARNTFVNFERGPDAFDHSEGNHAFLDMLDFSEQLGMRKVISDFFCPQIICGDPFDLYFWSLLHLRLLDVDRGLWHPMELGNGLGWKRIYEPSELFNLVTQVVGWIQSTSPHWRSHAKRHIEAFQFPPQKLFREMENDLEGIRSSSVEFMVSVAWQSLRFMSVNLKKPYPPAPRNCRSTEDAKHVIDLLLSWCYEQSEYLDLHNDSISPPIHRRRENGKWPTTPPDDDSEFSVGPLRGKLKDIARWMKKSDRHLRERNGQRFFYIQNEGSEYACWFQTTEQFDYALKNQSAEQNGTKRNVLE